MRRHGPTRTRTFIRKRTLTPLNNIQSVFCHVHERLFQECNVRRNNFLGKSDKCNMYMYTAVDPPLEQLDNQFMGLITNFRKWADNVRNVESIVFYIPQE